MDKIITSFNESIIDMKDIIIELQEKQVRENNLKNHLQVIELAQYKPENSFEGIPENFNHNIITSWLPESEVLPLYNGCLA